jgi:hypothetical protein
VKAVKHCLQVILDNRVYCIDAKCLPNYVCISLFSLRKWNKNNFGESFHEVNKTVKNISAM